MTWHDMACTRPRKKKVSHKFFQLLFATCVICRNLHVMSCRWIPCNPEKWVRLFELGTEWRHSRQTIFLSAKNLNCSLSYSILKSVSWDCEHFSFFLPSTYDLSRVLCEKVKNLNKMEKGVNSVRNNHLTNLTWLNEYDRKS